MTYMYMRMSRAGTRNSENTPQMGKKRVRLGRIERLRKTLSSKSQKLEQLNKTNKALINSVTQLKAENKLVNRLLIN